MSGDKKYEVSNSDYISKDIYNKIRKMEEETLAELRGSYGDGIKNIIDNIVMKEIPDFEAKRSQIEKLAKMSERFLKKSKKATSMIREIIKSCPDE